MDNGVMEVVVKRKPNGLMSFLRIFLILVAVIFILIGLFRLPALFAGFGAALGAWFAYLNVRIDYEYDLVDRELRLARIQNRSRRKSLGSYDLDKMEILAPSSSHELDSYRSQQRKILDFSAKDPARQDAEYTLILEGDSGILLTLEGEEGERLLRAIRQFAPRKVIMK